MNKLSAMSLRDKVYELMAQLPNDKVTTYGDLAAMAGHPYAARIVGGIAHNGVLDLPWHRLVNAKGQGAQKQLLEQDGIFCDARWRIIDFEERRWKPIS